MTQIAQIVKVEYFPLNLILCSRRVCNPAKRRLQTASEQPLPRYLGNTLKVFYDQ
jgi:hypothetical protein